MQPVNSNMSNNEIDSRKLFGSLLGASDKSHLMQTPPDKAKQYARASTRGIRLSDEKNREDLLEEMKPLGMMNENQEDDLPIERTGSQKYS